jgi:endoglucanase
MGKTICILIVALLTTACIPKDPEPVGPLPVLPPAAKAPSLEGFRRGINLGNALDAPSEGEWGVVLGERHFEMAKAAGLDHVRLPVRFPAHAEESAPFTIDAAFFQRVDWAIDQALSRGLSVLLDLHHYDAIMKAPAAHEARFLALWAQIAERYRERPPALVFELLNEPNGELSPPVLNALTRKAIAVVRRTNPSRRIVADGYFWASADYIDDLELPADDPALVATFHMYQPILFTHQGAHWMSAEYGTLGITFPGPPPSPVTPVPAAEATGWVRTWIEGHNTQPASSNPSGPGAVRAEFEKIDRYVAAAGRPVYLGEFGAIDKADPASRATWVRLVREEAERRGIAWAYWDDGGSFKAMDVKTGEWVPTLRDALLR